MLRATAAIAVALGALLAVACSSASDDLVVPTTVAEPDRAAVGTALSLRIGVVSMRDGPSAALDERQVAALEAAIRLRPRSPAATVLATTVEDSDGATGAIGSLAERGATVVFAPCDPDVAAVVVDAAREAELLAVAACASIPRPPIAGGGGLLDFATLRDDADAIARWALRRGTDIALLRSDLVIDVAGTCDATAAALASRGGTVVFDGTFTGLVGSPADALGAGSERLADADALVVCALPAVAPDAVAALRAAGYDQPIGLPWFASGATWPPGTTDVSLLAPAAADGDDPVDAVNEFLVATESWLGRQPLGTEVIAGEAAIVVLEAAERRATVGSRRLEDAILDEPAEALTGTLTFDPDSGRPIGRVWRELAVTGAGETFRSLVPPDG